jgi:putative hydrolase of the HAD superfamily
MTAVFFDLDGTLMDHAAAQRAAAQILRARCRDQGFSVLPEEGFYAAWREAEQTHFERYLAGALSFQEQRWRRVPFCCV